MLYSNKKLSFVLTITILFLVSISNGNQLIYSTFLGGSNTEEAAHDAIDPSGNVYIGGDTYSNNFPTTSGAYDTSYNGARDIFITKLNSTGNVLLYSTVIGGTGEDVLHGVFIDNDKNVYISGYTNSVNFPVTPGAYDTSYNGSYDAIFLKLNASGSSLVYSTYLGGSNDDRGYFPAVDTSGNVYATGFTQSSNFPTTPGAYDTSYNGGGYDAFVIKLNPLGSALVYSTFLGGSDGNYEMGICLDIDSIGNTYIVGDTNSSNFPTTPGAYDTSFNGGGYGDNFITKLNDSGSALIYSTFLGGSSDEVNSFGIEVDGAGNVYIGSNTFSSDFPVSPDAFDTTFNGSRDAFLAKFNPSGSGLIYSTFIGGSGDDRGNGFATDNFGNAYATGYTTSPSDFPITNNAFDTSYNGGAYDGFVSVLNSTGSELIYSTFIGGSGEDFVRDVEVDNQGNAFITGGTGSANFPTTYGAFDTTYNGGGSPFGDVFVSKLDILALSKCLNTHGAFTSSIDTNYWYFQVYGDGTSPGTLSWLPTYMNQTGVVAINQTFGEKGKLSQVFSVSTPGWYKARTKVCTNISDITKQQKVYLYLQELDNATTIVATGNQVLAPGNGAFSGANIWRDLEILFYTTETVIGVQVVAINPMSSATSGSLFIDFICVSTTLAETSTSFPLNNQSFDAGTLGWIVEIYGDGTGTGTWSGISSWFGHSGVLCGNQSSGEKAKVSQLCSLSSTDNPFISSVWITSGANSINNMQKVYLYVYSNDSGFNKIIESGNAILQPGKWTPGQWRQLQFGYTPLTNYNAIQLVGINPTGNPYQAIYFDDVEVKQ